MARTSRHHPRRPPRNNRDVLPNTHNTSRNGLATQRKNINRRPRQLPEINLRWIKRNRMGRRQTNSQNQRSESRQT